MRRTTAIAVAVALAVSVGDSALAATSATTKLSIKHSAGGFAGRATSPGQACIAGRTVKVHRRRPGPDPVVGSARTAAGGRWAVRVSHLASGDYYARAAAVQRSGVNCAAGRSVVTHVS